MKATLFAIAIGVCILNTLSIDAADPECKYRKIRGLTMHWPNPTDCARFYRCTTRNVKREIICPQGKVYSSRNGRCVTKRRGLCKLSMAAPLAGAANECADVVDGAFLPETGYCRQFYICHETLAYPQVCSSGSFFNATIAACEPDSDNSCWQNSCIGKVDGTYVPNKESCTQFYVCRSGEAIPQLCNVGSYFDETHCMPDVNEDLCWENLCLSSPDGAYKPNVDDCYGYYECKDAKPVPQSCQDGYYFDKEELVCVAGDCPDSMTTTTTTTTDVTTTTTEDTTTTTTTDVTTTTTEDTTTTTTTDVTTTTTEDTTTTTECPDLTTTTTECTTTTTECPTTTTTECPEEPTTTTTECPVEPTTTTTECPVEPTTTTTECPEEPTTTTTECPEEPTTTTTECPVEPTTTTTECPVEPTTTTTECPVEPTTTTTECPVEPTTTTTECPEEPTTTTTECPEEPTTTTTECPVEPTTTTTTECPVEPTTTTTECPVEPTTTTTECPVEPTTTTTTECPEEPTTTTTQCPEETTTTECPL